MEKVFGEIFVFFSSCLFYIFYCSFALYERGCVCVCVKDK